MTDNDLKYPFSYVYMDITQWGPELILIGLLSLDEWMNHIQLSIYMDIAVLPYSLLE